VISASKWFSLLLLKKPLVLLQNVGFVQYAFFSLISAMSMIFWKFSETVIFQSTTSSPSLEFVGLTVLKRH